MIRQVVVRRRLFAGVLGAVGALGVLAVSWLSTVDQNHAGLAQSAEAYIADLDRVNSEINDVLADLGRAPPAACSRALILQMRRAVTLHREVQDILFIPQGSNLPTCSANLGMNHKFTALPPPDPVPYTRKQREMWRSVPMDLFDGKVAASVVREGSFAVVSDVTQAFHYPRGQEWEVYFPGPDGAYGLHANGQEGLYAAYTRARHNILTRGLYANRCGRIAVGCITTHLTFAGLVKTRSPWIELIPVRALVFAGLLYALITRLLAGRGSLKGRIKVAIKKRQGFSCLYQPIVDIGTGQTIGCEALVRFEDEFGAETPGDFVPLVEELDQTWAFTEIVMETAMRDLAPLLSARPDFGLSINFFPRDLEKERIPRLAACPTLAQAARYHYKLHFEVLETGFRDLDNLNETIEFLHSRGFLVSIDDFGTGSSNLQQVHRLKADYLKIDRSFILGLQPDKVSIRASLVPQIAEIAHEVHADIIAEGVEYVEQVRILRALGITKCQGFYFSRPLSAADLFAFTEGDAVGADLAQA